MSKYEFPELSLSTIHNHPRVLQLKAKAGESGVDYNNLENICKSNIGIWQTVVDRFEALPREQLFKQNEEILFRRDLTVQLSKCRDYLATFFYGGRFSKGDQISRDMLLMVAVYILEGLLVPVCIIAEESHNWGFTFSDLEEMAIKCGNITYRALQEYDARILPGADAEDLLLRIVRVIKDTMTSLNRHPNSTWEALQDPNSQYSILNSSLRDLSRATIEHMEEFSKSSGAAPTSPIFPYTYGRGVFSDQIAVDNFSRLLAEISTDLKAPMVDLAKSGESINHTTVLESIHYFQNEIHRQQLQLFQRLRSRNHPCFGTLILRSNTLLDLASAGIFSTAQTGVRFWCESCESSMEWAGLQAIPNVADKTCPWRSVLGNQEHVWVQDRFAIEHHLPTPAPEPGNTQANSSNKWGKGDALFYCGYCWKWIPGKAVDPRFVFKTMFEFSSHLKESHSKPLKIRDRKRKGKCLIM